MDVCFLINQLAPGGAPTLLLDIVEYTQDSDIDFTVCAIEGDRTLVDDFEKAGAEVVDVRAEFKFDPWALARLARFFKQREFDIVHAHLPYAQTLGRVFGYLGGNRTVVSTQHNVPQNYHPFTRTIERVTRHLDARTVAVSEGVEQAFTGTSTLYEPGQQRKWCTIYNGIDVAEFSNAVDAADPASVRERWGIDASHIYLNISRYVEAKAQRDLVTAMNTVVKQETDSHLLIVGWGPLKAEIEATVEDNGLTDHVTVTGKVQTVHEYYALADAFVSSSVFEGLPIAHLEAMAAGLPVVATNIPGVDEVVIDGTNGLLVPPERPDQLAAAMLELRDPDIREAYGCESYQRVQRQFSIRTTVERHLALYRELAGDAAPSRGPTYG